MATRIKIGNSQLPIYAASSYALSGVLMAMSAQMYNANQQGWYGFVGRVSIIVFLVGAVIHVLDKLDRCVGKVWEAGGRAERRRRDAEAAAARDHLAVVRTMGPRT